MEYRKIAVALLFSLFLVSQVSGSKLFVDGLDSQKVNVSVNESHMRFTTEYMNQSLKHIDVFLPEELQDDLGYVTPCDPNLMVCQGNHTDPVYGNDGLFHVLNDPNNEFTDRFYIETDYLFVQERYDDDGDIPDGFHNIRINQEVRVNYSTGNTGLGQVLGTRFAVGDGKSVRIEVSAHYEHLILEYTYYDNSSTGNGTVVGRFTDVYSGGETNRVPMTANTRVYAEDGKRKQAVDVYIDNQYDGEHDVTVLVAYKEEYSFSGFSTEVGYTALTGAKEWYSVAERQIERYGLSAELIINDTSKYDFRAYNLTIPADATLSVSAEIVTGSSDYQSRIYLYVIGSIGGTTTFNSSKVGNELKGFETGDLRHWYGEKSIWTVKPSEITSTSYMVYTDSLKGDAIYSIYSPVDINPSAKYNFTFYARFGKVDVGSDKRNVISLTSKGLYLFQLDSKCDTNNNLIRLVLASSVCVPPSGIADANGAKVVFKGIDFGAGTIDEIIIGGTTVATNKQFNNPYNGYLKILLRHGTYYVSSFSVDSLRLYPQKSVPIFNSVSSIPVNWSIGTPTDISANVTNSDASIAYVEYQFSHSTDVLVDWTNMTLIDSGGDWAEYSYTDAFIPPSTGNYTLKIKVTDSNGAWNTSITKQKLTNPPPTISKVEYNLYDIGGTVREFLNISITDSAMDVKNHTSIPSGIVVTFTNSTLKISNPASVFDYIAQFADFAGLLSDRREINYTVTAETPCYTENATGTVNESWQTVTCSRTVNVRGEPMSLELNFSRPSMLVKEIQNGLSKTNITGEYTATGYWLVDHVETTVFDERPDDSKNHILDTQYIERVKQLANNWSADYSRLVVSPPPISGACSDCGDRTIALAGNSATNETYHASNDWITESEFEFTPAADSVTLGVSYIGQRILELSNAMAVDWTGLNTAPAVTAPPGCTQNNNSVVDLAASATTNYTVGFTCSPGNIGSPNYTEVVYNATYNRSYFNGTAVIESVETENTSIVFKFDKSRLEGFEFRAGNLTSFTVNGSGKNITVTGDSSSVYATVGTSHGNSSLEDGSYSYSLTYVYSTSAGDSDSGGGGGGGGGLSFIDADRPYSVVFGSLVFELVPGTEMTQVVRVTNNADKVNTVEVVVPDTPSCEPVTVRKSLTSNEFGKIGVYRLQPNQSTSRIKIRVDMPENATGAGFQCKLKVSASRGEAGSFVATVERQTGWLSFLDNVLYEFDWCRDASASLLEKKACTEKRHAEITVGHSLAVGLLLSAMFLLYQQMW